jgi:hypothetical protein
MYNELWRACIIALLVCSCHILAFPSYTDDITVGIRTIYELGSLPADIHLSAGHYAAISGRNCNSFLNWDIDWSLCAHILRLLCLYGFVPRSRLNQFPGNICLRCFTISHNPPKANARNLVMLGTDPLTYFPVMIKYIVTLIVTHCIITHIVSTTDKRVFFLKCY